MSLKSDIKSSNRSNTRAVLELAVIATVSALLLVSCGVMDKDLLKQGGGTGSNDAARAAFKTKVHPFVLSKCTGCHGAGGTNPRFAVPNVDQSYPLVREHSDFNDIPSGHFYTAASNGHCGTPACNATNSSVLLPLMQEWAKAELKPSP